MIDKAIQCHNTAIKMDHHSVSSYMSSTHILQTGKISDENL